jgi:hypothetical protein
MDVALIVFILLVLMFGAGGISRSFDGFLDMAPQIFSLKMSVAADKNVTGFSSAELDDMKLVVDGTLMNIKLVILGSVLAALLGIALFKGVIWNRISCKRTDLSYILRFGAVSIVWFFAWLCVIVALVLKIAPPLNVYILLAVVVLANYLTLVLFSCFDMKDCVGSVLRSARYVFRGNFLHYIAVAFVLLVILNILIFLLAKGWVVLFVFGFALFLAVVHLSRLYFYCIMRKALS